MTLPLAAGLLAAVTAPVTGAPAEPPAEEAASEELTQTEILKIQRERYSRYTIAVTIMGQGPFKFMIDTGAQATVLSTGLADRLELHDRDTATLVGMASREQVQTTQVPDFRIGSRNFDIALAPLVEGVHIGGADGILGLDSLQGQRVLLDFDKRLIAVDDAEDLGGNEGFDIVVKARRELGQLIITRARINGVHTSVIVDTGAQSSVGNDELYRRLRRTKSFGSSEMTDVNGANLTGEVRLARELEFGRARLTNFLITFAESPTFRAMGLDERPALILGMSELRVFRRVAIDFKSRRVLFDLPASATVPGDLRFGGVASRLRRR